MRRKLEIGPGKRPLGTDWLTLNAVGDPDLKRCAEDVPYPLDAGSLELIYASHVIEHVPWYLTAAVLAEWYRLLAPGGHVEIWVPDFAKIVAAYRDPDLVRLDPWTRHNPGRDPFRWLNGRLFNYADHPDHPAEGAVDHNWHKAVFDEWHLFLALSAAGFANVRRLAEPRGTGHQHGRRDGQPGWIELGMGGVKA